MAKVNRPPMSYVRGYVAGYNDGRAGRQYGDGRAAGWDVAAPDLCGIICNCGAKGEPLACAFKADHGGAHSWASLPTFTSESQVV